MAYALFPNARCELNYTNIYELMVAVLLSAQTTDVSVNKITPHLFEVYPDLASLAQADQNTLEPLIKSIGLYHTKAHHLHDLAHVLIEQFEGQIPSDLEHLLSLPGIGRKTANVIVSVGFNRPGLAVDTHVLRVCSRYGIVPIKATPLQTEMILKKALPEAHWGQAHHALLFFGRYLCTARLPKCAQCPLKNECRYKKMNP